ncbi:MAG: hypothetical protein AAFU79_09945 [Myxococcota bacterium]
MKDQEIVWVLKTWEGKRGVYKAAVEKWHWQGPVVAHPSGFSEVLRRHEYARTHAEAIRKVTLLRDKKASSLRSRLNRLEAIQIDIPE